MESSKLPTFFDLSRKSKWKFIGTQSLVALGIVLIVTALYSIPLLHLAIVQTDYDFQAHIEYAEWWPVTGIPPFPHMLFHAIFLAYFNIFNNNIFSISGLTVYEVAFLVCLTAEIALGAIAFQFFSEQFAKRSVASTLVSLALMGVLITLAPITFFTLESHNLYFGYVVANVYHSPTMYILKPLAFLNFIVVFRTLYYPDRFRTVGWIMIVAALTILSMLAKPNYMLGFLPTVVIWTAFSFLRKKKINWMMVIFGVVLPAVLVLGWQEYFTYNIAPNLKDSQIIFAPLASLLIYSDNLFPKFILSLIFPLSVYLLYFEKARKNTALNVAWVLFFFGAIQMYFFAESGIRLPGGNFWWSGEIAVFILFAVSIAFLVKRWTDLAQSYAELRKPVQLVNAVIEVSAPSGFAVIRIVKNFIDRKTSVPRNKCILLVGRFGFVSLILLLHSISGLIFLAAPSYGHWW